MFKVESFYLFHRVDLNYLQNNAVYPEREKKKCTKMIVRKVLQRKDLKLSKKNNLSAGQNI